MIFSVPPEPVVVVTPAPLPDPLDPDPPTPGVGTETVLWAVILPQGGAEITESGTRVQALSSYRLWFVGHIAIGASSRIQWTSRGVVLEAIGHPEYYPAVGSSQGHTEVIATLAEG